MMRKLVTMREALASDRYFGILLSGDSWRNWRVLLTAIVGEELRGDERAIFQSLTDRESEPTAPIAEFWAVVGRRGGKTRATAVLASYLAACCDHRHVLAPGERGVLPILAASTLQAQQAFNFTRGVFVTAPNLKGLIESETADMLCLSTGVDIQIRPASFRTIRGVTAIAAIGDEIAFWRSDDSANPDREILKALRPSLATTGGLLACISSPYAKRGELYGTFRRHYGPNGHPTILVAKAASRVMNPSLSQSVIDRATEEDAEAASAEYGAEFRGDLEVFVSREAINACVSRGLIVRSLIPRMTYYGFCDPSGGSNDSMTMAITHREGDRVVLDYIGERKAPFGPDSVVAELAEIFKSFRVNRIQGDRYGGEWPRQRFQAHGVTYEVAEMNRSELYLAFLPLVNSARIDLLDHARMITQFAQLERRTARSGRDTVDHPPGAHDDIANAVAGAAKVAARPRSMNIGREFLAAIRAGGGQHMDERAIGQFQRARGQRTYSRWR
jgi:hypothetical protein